MYTLKSIARRSTALGMAVAFVAATVMPAAAVFADALNPLTERSLLLTSSAPGFMDSDGSGNSSASPNSIGENYAPAGSGPNGKKAGQTFTFTHTSSASIQGFSLQYCTTAAGLCQAPGNNDGDERDSDRETNAVAHAKAVPTSDFDFVESNSHVWAETAIPSGALTPLGQVDGQYQVRINKGSGFAVSTGWVLTMANLEDNGYVGDGVNDALTGKNNYMTLTNTTPEAISSGDVVEIRFRPSEDVYITNPGSKEFFVKINTYDSATELYGPQNVDGVNNTGESDYTVVDGGVTVANVMTDSIHITTKVLETMSFSVGIQNRDTVNIGAGQNHGKCDPISTTNTITGATNNRLNLGNPSAEYSLETGKAWDVHSYWRLSSNSSGGATVYYSGDTLRNTVGDSIQEIGIKTVSTPGQEQFGLGFVDAAEDTMDTGPATWTNTDAATHKSTLGSYPFKTLSTQSGGVFDSQNASQDYADATGTIDDGSGGPGEAMFKFLSSSLTVPELIAQQNEMVISCATAKMRYVANIGADTPAGVYTTKVNYLAAPQY